MIERKIPTEEELAAAVRNAENLARSEEEKPESLGCWGNNFYMLFLARRREARNPNDTLVTTYLRKAESLGKPWQDFLSQNEALLTEIDSALSEWEILAAIEKLYRDLCVARKFDEADAFDGRLHNRLGMKAIAIPIYEKLNPLLEQAAAAIKAVGIEPLKLELMTSAK